MRHKLRLKPTTCNMSSDALVVAVASQYLNGAADLLQKSLPDLRFVAVCFENAIPGQVIVDLQVTEGDIQRLQEADVLVTDSFVVAQLAYRLPRLKWMQACAAGIDSLTRMLTPDFVAAHGVPPFTLTRFSGLPYARLMHEYCFCFIVSIERGFEKQLLSRSTRSWSALKACSPASYRQLHELTIAILGVGSIGSTLASMFRNHGSRVIGFGRRSRTELEWQGLGFDAYYTDLESALQTSDYVINVMPHTPATAGLLNEKFSSCLRRPVFINLGRGSVVLTDYLIKSLDEGLLSHAVLDVFETEPLPASSPLWTHAKVTLTPHVSCETRVQDVCQVFLENYHLFARKKPMKQIFDWNKLY